MKNIFYTLILTISFFAFGQKKELKQAQKLIDQEFFSEALDVLSNNKDLIFEFRSITNILRCIIYSNLYCSNDCRLTT